MSEFKLVMPKLGESVQEATITKWFVKEGDKVSEEQPLLEIATDKVDSEIPSPVDGFVTKVLFKVDDLVPVGTVIAIISSEASGKESAAPEAQTPAVQETTKTEAPAAEVKQETVKSDKESGKFFTPLVKTIAAEENIQLSELDNIQGTGINGRVRRDDLLNFIQNKGSQTSTTKSAQVEVVKSEAPKHKIDVPVFPGDEIIEMDRMRKLIADHMLMSQEVSVHVTNFIEVDVTNIVTWRNKVKDEFQKREKTSITYLPIFIEAIVRGLKDFPIINASVDGNKIILHKEYNIGIAVALPTGNLIVPVVKKADQLNLVGLAKEINRLAESARANKLSPDDIKGGTFSVSNFGTFKNLTGTPIINQPQVAIIATGNIEKKLAVIETPHGDMIGIRHKMILSMSYDHRIIDGAAGGSYLRRVADYLEQFDINRTV